MKLPFGNRKTDIKPEEGLTENETIGKDLDDDVDLGLPSVNRSRKGNKLINFIGLILIIGFGSAMLVAVNGDNSGKPKKSKDEKKERVENNLPRLVMPSDPPPPIFIPQEPAPVAVLDKGGVPPISMTTAQPPITGRGYSDSSKLPMTWEDRKRSGGLLIVSDRNGGGGGGPVGAAAVPVSQSSGDGSLFGTSKTELATKLEPTVVKASAATQLPDRNFLLAKPKSFDCVLETALDSSLPGITACILTQDVYSDNGKVLLMERGTVFDGEYAGGMKTGQVRLFVLWVRARTPRGVVVTINSPGADALGRTGMDGYVDNHFIKRFGAALMLSTIKDTFALASASKSGGSGGGTNVAFGNTGGTSERLSEKALESSINIPPTLSKNQGDHIQIMLARDLDFSGVYSLQAKE